jgi:hypothetical protein
MLAFIAILFPAVIMTAVSERIFFNLEQDCKEKWGRKLVEYAGSVLVINIICLFITYLISGNSVGLVYRITGFSDFALKYMVMATVLSLTLPYAARALKNEIHLDFSVKLNSTKLIWSKAKTLKSKAIYTYALVMAILHFIRMFDHNFWADEGMVVHTSRLDWEGMLWYVAGNGHTPFHYVVAWIMEHLFGDYALVYRFSATLPYFILLFLCVTLVGKWFGNKYEKCCVGEN